MPYSRLESLLKRSIGLSMPTVGRSVVDRPVQHRMSETGVDTIENYVQLIESDPAELQELIEAIVVPETWFFRDPEAFAALANWAVQEWRPGHPGETLRVLSLPCSTGEEAYSIAICLLNAGMGPLQFRVDGKDISYRNLSRAGAGLYQPNSFRGLPQKFSRSFLQETPEGVLVDAKVRTSVNFRFGNILETLAQLSPQEYDVVFCRNLLIYFSPSTQSQALENIDRVLAADGVLFVGSAEAFIVRSYGFQSLGHPMSFGFHKRKRALDFMPGKKSAAAPESVRRGAAAAVPRKTVAVASLTPPKLQKPREILSAPELPPDALTTAMRMADRGEFGPARELCETAVSNPRAVAGWYFLLGLIEDAENHPDKAAECYRRVLYLEPRNADALAHMALASDKLGDPENAARLRARAQRDAALNSAGGAH